MKKLLLASLIGITKVKGLIVRQCVHCPIALTLMLIACNQETTVQEEGEASSIASTSSRPRSITVLNDVSEGMSPLVRDHPMGVTVRVLILFSLFLLC